MKAIFNKLIAKKTNRVELQGVYVTKDKLVVTDSYSLLQVKQEALGGEAMKLSALTSRFERGILVKPEELDLKKEILETMPIVDGVSYPDYQQIIPTQEALDVQYVKIALNPRLLAEVALSIARTFKDMKYREVSLYIPKVNTKPVVIKRNDDSVIGLIMPLTNSDN